MLGAEQSALAGARTMTGFSSYREKPAMHDFDLYYWPLPFRGQFIRAILAYHGATWHEHDADANSALMARALGDQPVPFMGQPVLIDHANGFAISQMAAIAVYLGEKFALLPDTPAGRALTAKVVNDANDVIDELTLFGGRQMWTKHSWDEFVPRLQKWMQIFEDLGKRHGLTADDGYLLGTDQPTVADIVTSTLWATMAAHLPAVARLLPGTAPAIHGLSTRLQAHPALAALKASSDRQYGDAYCGGQIEQSLKKVAQ